MYNLSVWRCLTEPILYVLIGSVSFTSMRITTYGLEIKKTLAIPILVPSHLRLCKCHSALVIVPLCQLIEKLSRISGKIVAISMKFF